MRTIELRGLLVSVRGDTGKIGAKTGHVYEELVHIFSSLSIAEKGETIRL